MQDSMAGSYWGEEIEAMATTDDQSNEDRFLRAVEQIARTGSGSNGGKEMVKFLVELGLIVVTATAAVLTIKSDVRDLRTTQEFTNSQISQLQRDVKLQDAWQRQLEQQLIAAGAIKPSNYRGE